MVLSGVSGISHGGMAGPLSQTVMSEMTYALGMLIISHSEVTNPPGKLVMPGYTYVAGRPVI